MSVVSLPIQICNTAVITVGGDEINSFEDETREARVCAQLYPRIVASRMEMYPWRFSMKQVVLSALVGVTPQFNFQNAFQLPSDRLRAIFKSNCGTDYRIFGDKLYANVDSFQMEYQRKAPEEIWTESFRTGIELELTQMLYIALLEDEKKSAMMDALITRQWRIAKNVDGGLQLGDSIPEEQFSLTAVRPGTLVR